ncbi:MAG TPA: acyltransferase family protein, partial [Pseudoxanthomonas sp.]
MGSLYYPFIDGLRAIAVLAVVAYHLDPRWMPGGFSGVDMFFVISGFVVSASVAGFDHRDIAAFAGKFYVRRIRRIVPALLACLLATGLLAALFIPHGWLSEGSQRTGLMAFVGLSNFQLAASANDYFSPKVEFNPYTHTWSLGVEEQFYLLFPLIFLAWLRGGRWRKASIALFALGLASSLLYAWYLTAHGGQVQAFYLITARFWQLASGVLLYQCLARAGGSPGERQWPGLLRTGVLVLSFGLLAYAMVGSRPAHAPWPDGLAPVLGTLGVIAGLTSARPGDFFNKLLGSVPMVAIGRVSYSLYLWHWPVFVLFRWTVGLDSLYDKLLALTVAASAATFSYKWIETPFRRGAWLSRLRPLQVIVAGVLCVVTCGLLFKAMKKHEAALSRSTVVQHLQDWYPEYATPVPPKPGCEVVTRYEPVGDGQAWVFARVGCEGQGKIQPRLFVAGDSHATAYISMLRQYTMDTGAEVRLYHHPGCTFFGLGLAREFDDQRCKAAISAAVGDIRARAQAGDAVFLPALRLQRLSDQWVRFDAAAAQRAMTGDDARRARRDGIAYAAQTLAPIAERGVRVVFEAPKPLFQAPPYRCSDRFNRRNPVCEG